ncbi:MAG: FtsX-like permease family protein [Armatimonadota bacterium]|nr:M28 family peptidase [Armatimonadota bacterium]MCX7777595.1 M28 family peptidase [Armatimonadota bacterium]MDW8024727.1 FtsX-like permease family protein [Armatimonadota bacterium]
MFKLCQMSIASFILTLSIAVSVLAQSTAAYRELYEGVDEARIKEAVEHLSSLGSRVCGYPGERQAAEWVKQKFYELGLDELELPTLKDGKVTTERLRELKFRVTTPIDKGASVELTQLGRSFKLYPMWPNLVRTPQLPPEGVEGHIIYAHSGKLSEFRGKDVKDSIVLLDFVTGSEWFNAPFLGARAVIFIEPEPKDMARWEAEIKFLTTPIDIPRFWIRRDDAMQLLSMIRRNGEKPITARLRCRMEWEEIEVKDIVGVVWGSDPSRKDQFIVVSAYYDSMSVVPSLAPGAEQANSIAILLELARLLRRMPLDRTVVFLATSGHCLGLRGAAHFIRYWLSKEKEWGQITASDPNAKVPQLLAFIAIDISSRSPTFGVFYKAHFFDYTENIQWQFSDIGKFCRESAERIGFTFWFDAERYFVDGINPIKGKNWRTYLPGMLALDSEVATVAGKTGIGFATADDARPLVDTPYDLPSYVNFENVVKQARMLSCMLYDLINAPTNLLKLQLENNFSVVKGQLIWFDPEKSTTSVPDQPVKGAIACMRHTAVPKKTMMGVRTVLFDKVERLPLGKRTQIPYGPLVLIILVVTCVSVLSGVVRRTKKSIAIGILAALVIDVAIIWFRHPIAYLLAGKPKVEEELKDAVFEFVGFPQSKFRWGNIRVEGYKLDPVTGEINYAPDMGFNGAQACPIEFAIDVADKQTSVVLFPCKPMAIFDMIDQRRFWLLREIYIYDAVTGAEPFNYGYSLPVPQPLTSHYEPCAVVYATPGTRIKVTMGATVLGLLFTLLNTDKQLLKHPELVLHASDDQYLGVGFKVDDHPSIPITPYEVAQDMWVIDHQRMLKLRRYGIENERMRLMHERAREFLFEAKKELEKRNYDTFVTYARAAWSYESKAYPDVRKTAMDVIKGIIFYLMLLLPFAYFCERLFFYMTDLKWQITVTVLIFAVISFIMRYFHPAFAIINTTPMVIILGFIILALSIVVSVIVMRKFEDQMRQIKFETTGIHTADVGRFTAVASAFSLGVGNMRRRKARTVLTATTLILLTFTVISFTSVVPTTRINMIQVKRAEPTYRGVLIRSRNWDPLGEPTTRIIRDQYGRKYTVAPRAWYFSAMVGEQSFIRVWHNARYYDVTAIVGMSPQEEKVTNIRRAVIGNWLTSETEPQCLIPLRMARWFGIREKDILEGKGTFIQVLGMKVPVIGIIHSERMKSVVDLDGEMLTPVDYLMMQERRRVQEQPTGQEAMELEEYIHLSPDQVIIMPYGMLMSAGGNLRSVAIRFDWSDRNEAMKELRQLMDRVELNLFASIPERGKLTTYLCSAIGATGLRGVESIWIPMLIAALVVLTTMLGSVYERVREIGIYTALGLAPSHIGALFLAESSVYAVLGAIIGYLLGQIVAKLHVAYDLFAGLSLNYSSLAAVFTTAFVMLVVIASTAYPAWQASRVSVPGIERRWKLPEPEGDYLRMTLPFTVANVQALGVIAFLREYLEAHADYSLGQFSTDKVTLSSYSTEYGEGYRLEAMVWLAPYDLGVSEYFILETQPTKDIFANTIHITIRRESGDEASWMRVTRNFLNLIRKQFLIWRTFRVEIKERYREMGFEALMETQGTIERTLVEGSGSGE